MTAAETILAIYWSDDELLVVPERRIISDQAALLLLDIAARLAGVSEMELTLPMTTARGESKQVVFGPPAVLARAAVARWREANSVEALVSAAGERYRFDLHRDFDSAQVELGTNDGRFGTQTAAVRNALGEFAKTHGVTIQAPLQLTAWDRSGAPFELSPRK